MSDPTEWYLDAFTAAQKRVDIAAAKVAERRRVWAWWLAVMAVGAALLTIGVCVGYYGIGVGILGCVALLGGLTFGISKWITTDAVPPRAELDAAQAQLDRIVNGEEES